MKQLLLFLLLLPFGLMGQTKEETLPWLKDNQAKLLPTVSCDSINGEETATFRLAIKGDSLIYNIDYDGKGTWAVALKDIVYQEAKSVVVSKAPYYDACPELIYFLVQSGRDKIRYKRIGTTGVAITGTDSILSIIFNRSKKEDALQVLNAIMHLVKLDGAKEVK